MSQPLKCLLLALTIKVQEKIKELLKNFRQENSFHPSKMFKIQTSFQIYLLHGQSQAKYYLICPKIYIMTLYSIFLQTIKSLFPPLESRLHRTSNFPHKQCLWYSEQDELPTLFCTGKCPKLD